MYNKKIFTFVILAILALVLFFIYTFLPNAFVLSNPYTKDEISKEIENIYNIRDEVLLTKNMGPLLNLFDTSEKYG